MRIKAGLQAFAVGVVLMFGAVKAEAATYTFTANLSGSSEAPPNGSPGTGFATVLIDTVSTTMSVNVTFSGLLGPTTVAHIHCCTEDPFMGVAIPATQVPSFVGFPVGVTSGSYSNTFDLTLASTYNPAFIAANGNSVFGAAIALVAGLFEGTSYLNIHTTAFPNGEIRGFLAPPAVVPLPAALPLFASVLGVGGWLGYRRKRAQGQIVAT